MFVKLHRKFQSVAPVNNCCSRSSTVTMVMLTLQVVGRPRLTEIPAGRCSLFGRWGGRWAWTAAAVWGETSTSGACVARCDHVSFRALSRREWPCFGSSARCVGEDLMLFIVHVSNLNFLNNPKRIQVTPKL